MASSGRIYHAAPSTTSDGTYSRAGRVADDDARPPVPRGRAQHAPRGAGDLDRQDPGRLLTARSPIGSPSPGLVRSRDTTPLVPPTRSRGPTPTVRVRRHRHRHEALVHSCPALSQNDLLATRPGYGRRHTIR